MRDVRILLADDHEVSRRGLKALLEAHAGWQVVGEAANGREAVDLARELRPDVVVLDISMPELNGLDALPRILDVAPRAEILVLTMHESEEMAELVLSAGARGYVLKSDAGSDLVAAVDTLARHLPYLTEGVSSMLLDDYLKRARSPKLRSEVRLTPRERQVVQLLAEGRTNREAAEVLGISEKTVAVHRGNVMRVLGLRSVADLVRWAVRNNLVEP
jgi:DNA-binding NarL/FixJ family response regulator